MNDENPTWVRGLGMLAGAIDVSAPELKGHEFLRATEFVFALAEGCPEVSPPDFGAVVQILMSHGATERLAEDVADVIDAVECRLVGPPVWLDMEGVVAAASS